MKVELGLRLSLQKALLLASHYCGMTDRLPAHRYQVFFVAYGDFGRKHHEMDLQRAIESGVKEGIWENHNSKGNGEYILTQYYYQDILKHSSMAASNQYAEIRSLSEKPKYAPLRKDQCHFRLIGMIGAAEMKLIFESARMKAYINGNEMTHEEAITYLRRRCSSNVLSRASHSGTLLRDIAVDYGFRVIWGR